MKTPPPLKDTKFRRFVRRMTVFAWALPIGVKLEELNHYKAEAQRISDIADRYRAALDTIAFQGGTRPVAIARHALRRTKP